MNSWGDRKAMQEAKTSFWKKLADPANRELRKKCIKHPQFARKKFAEWGGFHLEEDAPGEGGRGAERPIPASVEFRVFDEDVASRENLVVLVLRTEGTTATEPTDPDQVWQCTWWPYEA